MNKYEIHKYEINTVCNLHLEFELCTLAPYKMNLRQINRNKHDHHMPIPKQKPIPKPKIVMSYRVTVYNENNLRFFSIILLEI